MLLEDCCFDSSAIERAAYDRAEQVLFVFFKGDASTPRVWAYRGVPRSSFDAFRQASSHGRYFQQRIRNQFPGGRMDHGAVQSLQAHLEQSGRTLQISWVAQLAGTTAGEDPLGLFF